MLLHLLSLFIYIFGEASCQEHCAHGTIRLADGQSQLQGRVEICLNDAWGTVCDDSWDQNDASVVCRQLGFSPQGAEYFSSAYFGPGNGSVLLDDVECIGGEQRLLDCPRNLMHNCYHHEDAGVSCHGIVILADVNITDVSVLVSWQSLAVKYDVTITQVMHSSRSGTITEVPGSETVFMYEGLLPEQNYTVCVIGHFSQQQAISACQEFRTLSLQSRPPSSSQELNTASQNTSPPSIPSSAPESSPALVKTTLANSALLHGILGSIIAVLVVLLILGGAGITYIFYVRHGVKDKQCHCTGQQGNDKKLLSKNSLYLGMISNEAYVERSQQFTASLEDIHDDNHSKEDLSEYEVISGPPTDEPTPEESQLTSEVTAGMTAQHYEICEVHLSESLTSQPVAYEVLEQVTTAGGENGQEQANDVDDYLQLQN